MTYQIYIDGRQGTTGLEIDRHLASRYDIKLLLEDPVRRKDIGYKKEQFEQADVVILCLPDEVAIESANLSDRARLIDASTAHRTAKDWIYGLPELTPTSRDEIKTAKRVSNPGCYPTGFLLAIRPLVDANLISKDVSLQVHAVSGYSGGGKKLIERYEKNSEALLDTRAYSLGLPHKHLPEMQCHAGLSVAPFFLPSVGPFFKGMVVKTVLNDVRVEDVQDAWEHRYGDEPFVKTTSADDTNLLEDGFLSAMRCNETNCVQLLATETNGYVLVCAILDNLGKGAASAAVQNLNLMLGVEETCGLDGKIT